MQENLNPTWDRPASLTRSKAVARTLIRTRKGATGWLLVLPALAILTLFTYGPALLVVAMSFYHWSLGGFQDSQWVGALHYRELFNPVSGFLESLSVTFYYVGIMVPMTIALGLGIAWLFRGGAHKPTPWVTFTRAAVFLPYITPAIATSIIWVFIFNPQFGLANAVLRLFHLPALGWLVSSTWALPAVMINNLWHNLGFTVVLFLAGLSNIPGDAVEAAWLDGANGWQTFRYVILPYLSPVTLMVVILTTIQAMQAFGSIYAMTGGQFGGGGGPLNSTTTTAIYLYKSAFIFFHYGYGAAVSVVLFALLLLMTIVQKQVGERYTSYQ
ncbi:MAG: sugar ABC transporter permease [Firmicutes bacterium]|uniref:ABC transmembrane type-1 domain-containing protein n=1 Tax=Sulfobacillus benefaciens TaxID=453960 RepID=A0A2T2WZB6_9FIRM|nr:sugar ABC transporter permease [Bacillota bacterium]MCL5013406.1 sugar ABC transporter permease [Bacillota bacterium]PSR27572.1 MAG: hypothetical protein C7B43_11470 [Sulfobacillus benefaciens]